MKYIIVFSSILALLFSQVPLVFAEQLGLGVFPPVITMNIKQPSIIQAPLQIKNSGGSQKILKISFVPFTGSSEENGAIEYHQDTLQKKDKEFFSHVSIIDNGKKINEIQLAPQQQKNLLLQVDTSAALPTEDKYFSVIFEQENLPANPSNRSLISLSIATNVLIAFGDISPHQAQILDFTSPLFLEKPPVPMILKVANQDQHYMTVRGFITITNMFGQTIAKIDLVPTHILSQTNRYLESTQYISNSIKSINADLHHPVIIWNDSVGFGTYTATAHLFLSEKGPEITKTHHFILLPINAILGIIIAILLFLLIRKRVKSYLNQ